MEFHFHFYFSFLSTCDIEKRIWIFFFVFRFSFSPHFEKGIWISVFVFRFLITLKNGFEFRFSCFVFASLWKTDFNFVFRICIACYHPLTLTEKQIGVFCMNLKSGLIHQSFETPPPSVPCGFRPFDFYSKLKIENQKFTISIVNFCF